MLQINPKCWQKDLDEVAAQAEHRIRATRKEVHTEIARAMRASSPSRNSRNHRILQDAAGQEDRR